MRRSNLVGEVRAVLTLPAFLAGILVGTFVCLNEASAKERHGARYSEHHRVVHAHRFAGHHLLPMEASNGSSGYDFSGYGGFGQSAENSGGYSGMAAAQASAAGVPVSLVERVIKRESGGNAHAVHAGNYGLMQIRLGTARAMGYTGSAAGLLDPQTNMTYAVRYLAGAYRAAGGNEGRAVALYASGYYAQAKARGLSTYQSAAPAATGTSFGFFTPVAFNASEISGGAPVYRSHRLRRHAT
jgi:hypothetical protein